MQRISCKKVGLLLILALVLVGGVQAQQQHEQQHPGGAQTPQQQPAETGTDVPAQPQQMQGMMENMQGMLERFPRSPFHAGALGHAPGRKFERCGGTHGSQRGKILAAKADPVRSILRYLAEHPTDLVVLATHQCAWVARWMHRAVAAPIARRSRTMTLFISQDVEGFIALDDGAVTLRRMLIPIDKVPGPQAAVDVAAGLARTLGCHEVSFTLVYVGATGDMPAVHEPRHAGWTWDRTVRRGDVVEQILDIGTACATDCIVLTTQGHQGFLDALCGSTSERILRSARCPILAMPAT